jgi:hypothetical protein
MTTKEIRSATAATMIVDRIRSLINRTSAPDSMRISQRRLSSEPPWL